MKKLCLITLVGLLLFIPQLSEAQETQVVYLSGTGFDQIVEWDFYCTMGIPDSIKQAGLFKIFLYNPSDEIVFVDDFSIIFQ